MTLPALGSVVLASPAAVSASQWWVGDWADDPLWCTHVDGIGSVTPAPISISDSALIGYENSRQNVAAAALNDVGAVHLSLQCDSEGASFEQERLLLRHSDTQIWIWWVGGAPELFQKGEI